MARRSKLPMAAPQLAGVGTDDASLIKFITKLFKDHGIPLPADIGRDLAGAAPWAALLTAVLAGHIKPKRGRPLAGMSDQIRTHERREFLKAGGSLAVPFAAEAVERHQQAQFVISVRKAQGAGSQAQAFERLAGRLSGSLPRRYKRLTTPRSIKNAFGRLDPSVRADPAAHLTKPFRRLTISASDPVGTPLARLEASLDPFGATMARIEAAAQAFRAPDRAAKKRAALDPYGTTLARLEASLDPFGATMARIEASLGPAGPMLARTPSAAKVIKPKPAKRGS